jgi:hypothetical protein
MVDKHGAEIEIGATVLTDEGEVGTVTGINARVHGETEAHFVPHVKFNPSTNPDNPVDRLASKLVVIRRPL